LAWYSGLAASYPTDKIAITYLPGTGIRKEEKKGRKDNAIQGVRVTSNQA